MSLVQTVTCDQDTFGHIQATVLSMAFSEGGRIDRIDDIFDIYRENSIKNSKKLLPGEEPCHQLQQITGTHTDCYTIEKLPD